MRLQCVGAITKTVSVPSFSATKMFGNDFPTMEKYNWYTFAANLTKQVKNRKKVFFCSLLGK